jgi:hypothetical protein
VQQSNGTFTLANRGSGLLLDDYEWAKTSGSEVDQWAPTGGYQIVNHESGLALTDTYPASGEAIIQAAAVSGDADQVWTLVPYGSDFLIKNAGTGRFITIAQDSSADLANAVSWTQLDTLDQLWTVHLIDTT